MIKWVYIDHYVSLGIIKTSHRYLIIRCKILPILSFLSIILVLNVNLYTALRIIALIHPLSIAFISPFCIQRIFSVSKNGFCIWWLDNLLTYGAQSPITSYLKWTFIDRSIHLFKARRRTKLFSSVVCISTLLRLYLIDHFSTLKGLES